MCQMKNVSFTEFCDFFQKFREIASVKMALLNQKALRETIANFYQLNKSKGKNFTFANFKHCSVGRSTIYGIMDRIDKRGNNKRKSGSGRPRKMSASQQQKLKRTIDHKTGMSQRKLASKFEVSVGTINNSLKRLGVSYFKRRRAPKHTEEQAQRQNDRLKILADKVSGDSSSCDIVMDDESYFTLSGAGMPGNFGYYSSDRNRTPNDIRLRDEAKFPEKVMIWCCISRRGISDVYVAPKRTLMDALLYQTKCLSKVLKFVDSHYDSRDEVLFWPDLATCHYATINQDFMTNEGLPFVKRHENPPNAPQLRPIENFWGLLKQRVYAGNYSAKTRDELMGHTELRLPKITKDYQRLPS